MTGEIRSVVVPFERYVAECRDAERFVALCRQCPRYATTWACPPLPTELPPWEAAVIFAARIILPPGRHSVDTGDSLIAEDKVQLDRRLLQLEARYGGRACSFGGSCRMCDECTRTSGLPCHHPELLRPSLEALGFDISRTLAYLPGMELKWAVDGVLPSEMILVGALFTNTPHLAAVSL